MASSQIFAKKARSQLIRDCQFTAARALDFLVCGAINEPRLLADRSISNQFFCVLRPESLGHQEARIVGMSRQLLDQSHT